MPHPADTITAIATPVGRGGVGMVRVSGPIARAVADGVCGAVPQPRRARLAPFAAADGTLIDHGLVLWFPAPHSFTGEDVLELHAHGSPVVLDRLLRRTCELGARLARAGEFSERAFLNGKLDLAQAEAVADLIAARSDAQARAALRSLDGEFSRRVDALRKTVLRLRVEIEAAIDFADDASEAVQPATLLRLFDAAQSQFAALLAATRRGARLSTGLRGAIVGAPNVGKSSLLNALVGDDRAIVTDIPGTTRDVLSQSVNLDGVDLDLVDTAGLRATGDAIEREGVRRAHAELARADIVLWVTDVPPPARDSVALPGTRDTALCLVVHNKIDLSGELPRREIRAGQVNLYLSARTGAGLGLLRTELRGAVVGDGGGNVFSARTRHVLALQRAGAALSAAHARLASAAPELVAEDLRTAQQALGEITGAVTTEDLLGAIFATFCVGK